MRRQLLPAWYICRKDLRAYGLKPPLLSWGLMFPLVMVLAFYLRSPGDIASAMPGLVGITILFGATSMEAVVITFESRAGALERLAMAPVSPAAILLGKTASGALFGLVLGTLTSLAAMLLIGTSRLTPPLLLGLAVTLVLGAVVFASLGALVSVAAREVFDAMTMANYVRFPMLFLSGVFAPLVAAPEALRAVALLLPLTYVVDGLRHVLGASPYLPLAGDWAAALVFSLGLWLAAWQVLVRRLEEPA